MALIKLQRASHGKAAWATYAFHLFKMEVYLRNNLPCNTSYGELYISCYLHPNSSSTDAEPDHKEFTSYREFRAYRASLQAEHGSDKRLKNLLNQYSKSIIPTSAPDFESHSPFFNWMGFDEPTK